MEENTITAGYCVGDTSQVGIYSAGVSPYGALDMAGNVWEWVNDWWNASYYASSPSSNPTGPTSGTQKVMRGGSWATALNTMLVANRNKFTPDATYDDVGFRCAR